MPNSVVVLQLSAFNFSVSGAAPPFGAAILIRDQCPASIRFAGALGWLIMVRAQWNSSQFWLVTLATGTMALAAVPTLRVNIPINNQLMTWRAAAPPENMREIWNRWEKIHTIRTILWLLAFALEVIALGILAR